MAPCHPEHAWACGRARDLWRWIARGHLILSEAKDLLKRIDHRKTRSSASLRMTARFTSLHNGGSANLLLGMTSSGEVRGSEPDVSIFNSATKSLPFGRLSGTAFQETELLCRSLRGCGAVETLDYDIGDVDRVRRVHQA